MALAPDGRTVATAGSDEVQVWSRDDAGHLRSLGDPRPGRKPVAFVDDRTVVVRTDKDSVQLWYLTDPAGPQQLGEPYTVRDFRVPTLPDSITSLAVDPLGRVMAVSGISGGVRMWDISEPGRVASPHREPAEPVRVDTAFAKVLAPPDSLGSRASRP